MQSLFLSKNFLNQVYQRPILYLVPIWLLVQLLIYQVYGIRIVFDSYRYFSYVDSLTEGTTLWQQSDSIFYASYTLFLYFFSYALVLPIEITILAQLIISALAAYYLYKTTWNLTHNKVASFISCFLFIIWHDLQVWNFYIHTESLYTSFTIFILYLISIRSKSYSSIACLSLVLLVITFLRPNGCFITFAAFACSIIDAKKLFKIDRAVLYSMILAAVFTSVCGIKFILDIFSPLDYLAQGQVIQGYKGLSVKIASITSVPNRSNLEQLIYTISEQPIAYLRLLLLRFFVFWGQIRPYYSITHNIIIGLFFFPTYIAALLAIKRTKKLNTTFYFMVIVIILQTGMAMIIAVDWDNRFILPLLPFVFILASISITIPNSYKTPRVISSLNH
ncbi:hypothetical protein WG947_16725 [Pontibacter sp. H259]|uniref:hypothetical protein n=1 Tax=Pontibacter sp. H259 TaxID=3133421 RepID=UPI0030C187D4